MRDSLLIQLEQRGLKRSLAFRLVKRCWRELAAHKYEEAARLLDVEPEAVAEALEVIRSLTPDPGCAYAPGGNPHLLPDVIVEEGPSGVLDVVLTSEYLPRLSMNERYMELMAESSGSRELRQYLRKAFREGQELLRALDMRQETVLRLARAIVRRQKDFFRFGPVPAEGHGHGGGGGGNGRACLHGFPCVPGQVPVVQVGNEGAEGLFQRGRSG